MIWDDEYWDSYDQTAEQRARKPWKAVVVHETEFGEQHVYPDDSRHIPEPRCFCGPFLDMKNEAVWIHRRIDPIKVVELTQEDQRGSNGNSRNG
jgi:hypothetical protein